MRRKGEHLERVAAALCNLAPPLREQRHGAHDERRARVRRQGCARREDGAARVGRGARVLVCQHEGAHLHPLAEADLLAERMILVAQRLLGGEHTHGLSVMQVLLQPPEPPMHVNWLRHQYQLHQ